MTADLAVLQIYPPKNEEANKTILHSSVPHYPSSLTYSKKKQKKNWTQLCVLMKTCQYIVFSLYFKYTFLVLFRDDP